MSQVCQCPRGASIPTIPVSDCPETFGQIQKVAFQRLYKEDGTANVFTSADDIKTLASWTAKMTAADSTKIAVSPYIQAPTTEPGAPRTFGGGNETLSGVEEIIGREPTAFTAAVRKIQQSVITAMKEMQCEEIGVFLFDENGVIGAIQGGTTQAPTYAPIPIRSFFVGDLTLGGYEAPDSNAVQWNFLPNWSDGLVHVIPDFNPLTDLRVVAP